MSAEQTDVLVVGAGPIGLMLTKRLRQLGLSCILIEKRQQPLSESRSIGIHPPGAAMLRALGKGESLQTNACRVTTGVAHGSQRTLGTLHFTEGILTLSQVETMKLLDVEDVRRGVEFMEATHDNDQVKVAARNTDGQEQHYHARWLVGCDGHQSRVRTSLGIAVQGGDYPDHFIMGDFPASEGLGQAAHIFVHRDGLAEALPLDNGSRRWVARLHAPLPGQPQPDDLLHIIAERTGYQLDSAACTMIRTFTAQHRVAEQAVSGRIALAGDAAHVMSPIGGQGMNVGWMDAWELADIISGNSEHDLAWYDLQCRTRAEKAIRISERNMSIGRPSSLSAIRSGIIWMALRSPLCRYLDRLFTLQCVPFSSDFSTR